jgi:hypothetical protein
MKKKGIDMTKERYDALVKKQKGCCAICKEIAKKLVVDHCHKTTLFRGLLCSRCNIGIGHFLDDPKIAARAAAYLLGS